MNTSQFTTSDATRIRYQREGAGPRCLLFLHAFGTNRSMWEDQFGTIPTDWSAVAYDMRGCGGSGSPAGLEAYSLERLAADFVELLDHLGIESAVVCGLSMGASVALSAAAFHPQRIDAAILASVGAGLDNPGAVAANSARWTQLIRAEGVDALAAELIDGPLFSSYASRGPSERERVRTMIDSWTIHGMINTLEGVTLRRAPLQELLRQLPSLKMPTLVILGEADAACQHPSRAIAGALKEGHLQTIPGAGHFCNMEQPAEFNRLVRAFLAESSARP